MHNQISYSVSPEYFTKFKFEQFHISPHSYDRLGAGFVGWQASWWMGLIIGSFLIPAGMLVRDNSGFVIGVLRSFLVVLCTTLIIGLTALLVAYFVVYPDPTEELVFRNARISDPAAFRRAGAMHNFSYLGGLLGIVTGLASILKSFLAENARLQIAIPDDEEPKHSD